MIAFVVALKSEASPLLECFENLSEDKLFDKPLYHGNLFGKRVILAISGIGKVSAALTTQAIICKFSPSVIINFGSCGGINQTVKTLSYYCVEKACQFDFDVSALDDVPRGYIQEYDRVYFTPQTKYAEFLQTAALATSDKFVDNIKDVEKIAQMGCNICDMEGGAIAQVCTGCSMPLIMIKGISDVFGNNSQSEQFRQNLNSVIKGFPQIIKRIMDNIPE